jgi:hypothetical protein
MKRVVISILAIVYLTTSVGITLHYHYCMGKLVSWELRDETRSRCGKCGMVVKPGPVSNQCCKDEYKHFKIDNDQNFSENIAKSSGVKLVNASINSEQRSEWLTPFPTVKLLPTNPKQRRSQQSLNVMNCTFRI